VVNRLFWNQRPLFWIIWTAEINYSEWDKGNTHVVVKKNFLMSIIPVFPGSGGDMSGTLYVYDKSTGRLIKKEHLEMVSMAEEVFNGE